MGDPFSNSDPITPNDKQQYCSICNGKVKNMFQSGIETCPNCGTPQCETYEGDVPAHAPSPVNPNKGTNPMFIPKTILNASYNLKKVKHRNKNKRRDHAEHDDDTIKDVYTTEFDACMMGNGIDKERKKRLSVDDRKDEVMKSCRDLEIDG